MQINVIRKDYSPKSTIGRAVKRPGARPPAKPVAAKKKTRARSR